MATRLPFRLPEWAPRITWASAEAREVWEPRIRAVSQAYSDTEVSTVGDSRPSALINVSEADLPAKVREAAGRGLLLLPLARVPAAQGYQSASRSALPGERLDYRCALTKPEHAAAWAQAWEHGDNEAIGKLLGYPECCRQFFERVWVKERWMDTTLAMTECDDDPMIFVNPGVNMLWRWHGVRPVSHLPCSFHCKASAQIADNTFKVLRDAYPQEAAWMQEILSWPVKWTALNGIAEITTPIHRTSVASDATRDRIEIRYLGTGYPDEGVAGSDFPHRSAKVLGFVRRVSNHADNGFGSPGAMRAAHRRLLSVIEGRTFGTVVDLGCGDGELLKRIPAKRRVGVEMNHERAGRAARRIDRVEEGDCSDYDFVYNLLRDEKPDLVIAQEDRNPTCALPPGYRYLSYSYESGRENAKLFP